VQSNTPVSIGDGISFDRELQDMVLSNIPGRMQNIYDDEGIHNMLINLVGNHKRIIFSAK